MSDYLAGLDAIFAELDPPPPWPAYTVPWVLEAIRFRDALLTLKRTPSSYPSCCMRFNGRHTTKGVGYLLGRRLRKRFHEWKFSPVHFAAHYVAWQIDHDDEPVPQGIACFQTCKIPDCINPLHLDVRTSSRDSKFIYPQAHYYNFSLADPTPADIFQRHLLPHVKPSKESNLTPYDTVSQMSHGFAK